MNSSDYFKRGARTFPVILGILLGIRLASVFACNGDECRIIIFEESLPNKAINGHIIRSQEVTNEGSCRMMCYMEPNCVSVNLRPVHGGKYKCELNNATIDESKLTFLEDLGAYYLAIENACSSSPCLNNGTCQVGFTSKGFRCVCVLGFVGENCVLPKSCCHLKKLHREAKSGLYMIDPDSEGELLPYKVMCDMTDKNGVGVTVISHDSEDRTLVKGCEDAGCYSRNINYTGASLFQLKSLTAVSLHCEQFVKYECYHSRMKGFAWWLSRDSKKMTYWGGAKPRRDVGHDGLTCACGMKKTCAEACYCCNCDANDPQLREDSGFLSDKTDLPVKQLRFGDTGHNSEHGYHTLGKLKCYGTA